jgi:membrane protein required for colicin V production
MPEWDALNTFDWIILAILTLSIFSGVWRGFSSELFGLVGLVAAFFITSYMGKLLDGPMASFLPDNAMGHMFGRAIVFLGCILVINIMVHVAAAALREVLSRAVDHSLGLLFGFLRGALIILLPYLLVNLYIDPKVYPDWLTESHSYPFLNGGAHILRQLMPAGEIDDRKRADFSEVIKPKKEPKKLLDQDDDGDQENLKKGGKNKDSTGNSMWKDVIENLKEVIPN